jgi:hypothetical protein
MPAFEITATIEVTAAITADTAEHARELFDRIPITRIANTWGDLEVHDVNPIPSERTKGWPVAYGPLGPP